MPDIGDIRGTVDCCLPKAAMSPVEPCATIEAVESTWSPQPNAECAARIESEVVAAYRQHAAGLLRYAVALTRNPDLARDAVQEVFLRYFVERNYGRQIDHPHSWLYKVLRNYLLDCFKAAAGRNEVVPESLESVPDPQSNPETILAHSQLASEFAAALSSREMDCLRLRSEGMCYADIAEAMGVESGTVGAFLARAQKKLRPAARHFAASGIFEAARLLFAEAQNGSR